MKTVVAVFFFLSAVCFAQSLPVPMTCNGCYFPPLVSRYQYVLSTAPDLSISADLYDIDAFDNSAAVVASIHGAGHRAVCYVSAGSWENWRPDAAQFPASVKGNNNGWPGEKWLDIRQISILGPIMQARMDLCKQKGFDAIEFDNVDGYTNKTGFSLKYQDQLTYNSYLANQAHLRGLSVGLKNDVEQVPDLLVYFDFTVNEQCFQYNECDTLTPFIQAGKPVFNVEYKLSTSKFCSKANARNFNSSKKKLALDNYVVFCR